MDFTEVILTYCGNYRVYYDVCMCVLIAQSCPTFCDPVDCNPPGSSVLGILQARILEQVAISFSRGSSLSRDCKESACRVRGFDPLKKGMVTPVFLPGDFHGLRSLAGNSPWCHKESDMTEQLTQIHIHHDGGGDDCLYI